MGGMGSPGSAPSHPRQALTRLEYRTLVLCIEVTLCWLSTRCFLPNALRSWGEPVEQELDALFNAPLCVASALHKILHGVLFLQSIVSSCILVNAFAAFMCMWSNGQTQQGSSAMC